MTSAVAKTRYPLYPILFVIVTFSLLILPAVTSTSGLASFSTDFQGRHQLIQLFNALRRKAGDRLFPPYVIGEKGWILPTGDESIQDYQHTNPLSPQQLQLLQEKLDRLDGYLRSEGRTLLVVVVPNKNTIYARYVPQEIPVLSGTSRLDQFEAYMQAHGKARILDLRSALIEASQSRDVYYKVNTHWNDAGAYVAYREIIKALSARYPALRPYRRAEFRATYVEQFRDMGAILGVSHIPDESWRLMPRRPAESHTTQVELSDGRAVEFTANPNADFPSLLIFHDSFYDFGLKDFLALNFSHITAVPDSPQPGIWSAEWVRLQPSDVVMVEVTERFLYYLFPLLDNLP